MPEKLQDTGEMIGFKENKGYWQNMFPLISKFIRNEPPHIFPLAFLGSNTIFQMVVELLQGSLQIIF